MKTGVNGNGDARDYGGVINREALAAYVERIERLHDERQTLNEDIKTVYAEAKSAGFDTTILREIVSEKRMEEDARHSRYSLLDSYRRALGMFADTPLGAAAMHQAETAAATGSKRVRKPRPFAETPIGSPRRPRGRPRKNATQAVDPMAAARAHLGSDEPAGSA